MTTSIFNASASTALTRESAERAEEAATRLPAIVKTEPTLASRFVILTLCLALVLSTLAFGTVHSWALAGFQIGATLIVAFWVVDAWRSKQLRLSRNLLQLPLLGLCILAAVQLLPFGLVGGSSSGAGTGALSVAPVETLSLDPYATRFVFVQISALLVYFAAALAFIDTPRRFRVVVNTIIVFGFLLAIFGLIQSFTSPTKIYWVRENKQSTPFGPFINRHHFAGYMELVLALPLGILFSGALSNDKRLLYAFAAALMGIGLVMTNSRGGIIALVAEIVFLVIISGIKRKGGAEVDAAAARKARLRAAMVRAGVALALMIVLFMGVLFFGGENVLSRFVGTVNAEDPTTGRAHFWATTLQIIRDHPLLGVGLGAYGVAYTQYDTRNGLFRIEQAHNDYLETLANAGVVGALLGVFFIVWLFRTGFARRETQDDFRRGVSTGALAGCFAVLVHSFFDFTLHTTSNALLFLVVIALATADARVEQVAPKRHRRRRHHQAASATVRHTQNPEPSASIAGHS